MVKHQLTADRLRSLLEYDCILGIFTWRLNVGRHGRIKIGTTAATNTSDGYIKIKVDGRSYLAHRLAWLHITGAWPIDNIDHIDGNKKNNAISNLRDVSKSINAQNQRGPMSNNTHGFMGVSPNKNRWSARIKLDGKHYHLGNFSTPEDAHTAYLDAKRKLHAGCRI